MNPLIGALVAMTATAYASCAQAQPSKTFVDDGACPFECCQYGQWHTVKSIDLYPEPVADKDKVVIRVLTPDVTVSVSKGKVITQTPGRALVSVPHVSVYSGVTYAIGDELLIYTSFGEGVFLVWYEGRMYKELAGFMLQADDTWQACAEVGHCWGRRLRHPVTSWWVGVEDPVLPNQYGWTRDVQGFAGKGSCG